MARALTLKQVREYNPVVLDFEGPFAELLGRPELTGSWIIWGASANGKTRFALQLARYLCQFAKVAYNSLEEGLCFSVQNAINDIGFADAKSNFLLLDQEPIEELKVRLKKQRSPDVIIIDSLQYTGLTYKTYTELRKQFPRKLFIFLSHADGLEPKGGCAKSVRYDAFVKIRVEGFKAYAQSRYGGGKPYVIYEKGAREFEMRINPT